jgi:hypothetical protein
VRRDVERAMNDKNNYRTRKQQMATTLRDTLRQQQSNKRQREEHQRSQDKQFNYQFPFSDGGDNGGGFFISP